MNCPSCKKILDGNSPDLITVHREDTASLGVDIIREMRKDVWIAPNDTDFKIYLIEEAHLMNEQAQNALLLTLEEPPAYVFFLLLCETTSTLLETIRSRASTLHTEPVDKETMDRYLCEKSTEARALKASNPHEYYEMLATSDGCIGTALALLSPSARKPILEKRERAREFVHLCSDRKSAFDTFRYINSLGARRETVIQQLNVTLLCLRDLLLCKQADEPSLCFFAECEEAHNLAYRFTTPDLLRLCSEVNEAVNRLKANANVKLTMTSLAVGAGMIQI